MDTLFDVYRPDPPALVYRKPYPKRKRCRDCHKYARMCWGGGCSDADSDLGGEAYFYLICSDCCYGRSGFRPGLAVNGLHGRAIQEIR